MKYRHYKGGIYEVLCEARLESDPDTVMVVYRSEQGQIWTRPGDEFFGLVQRDGITVQRFAAFL